MTDTPRTDAALDRELALSIVSKIVRNGEEPGRMCNEHLGDIEVLVELTEDEQILIRRLRGR